MLLLGCLVIFGCQPKEAALHQGWYGVTRGGAVQGPMSWDRLYMKYWSGNMLYEMDGQGCHGCGQQPQDIVRAFNNQASADSFANTFKVPQEIEP